MTLDYTDRLYNEVNKLELDFPVFIGLLDRADSVALRSTAGSRITKSFYDGTKDKLFNHQFSIKTKDQEKADNTLLKLAEHLEDVEMISSLNGSYNFQKITIVDEPFFVGEDTNGFFFYQLTIQSKLTIFKEEK